MKKLLVAGTVAGLLFAGAGPALAAKPDGTFKPNDNQNSQSCFGALAAQITQNGQFVSGNGGGIDQTTYPGSRADAVHSAQDACNS